MKRMEWIVAVILIVIGLHCLVMAGILLPGAITVSSYLILLFRLCFWTGIPIFIGCIIYMIVMKINKKKGNT